MKDLDRKEELRCEEWIKGEQAAPDLIFSNVW